MRLLTWLLPLGVFLALACKGDPVGPTTTCRDSAFLGEGGVLTVTVYDDACQPYRCFYRVFVGTSESVYIGYCRFQNELDE